MTGYPSSSNLNLEIISNPIFREAIDVRKHSLVRTTLKVFRENYPYYSNLRIWNDGRKEMSMVCDRWLKLLYRTQSFG